MESKYTEKSTLVLLSLVFWQNESIYEPPRGKTNNVVFSHLGFWSGNLFLIAPFPDLCLLVPFEQALQKPGCTSTEDG